MHWLHTLFSNIYRVNYEMGSTNNLAGIIRLALKAVEYQMHQWIAQEYR